jgi:dihydroorotate dehydrogenase (fumarate)
MARKGFRTVEDLRGILAVPLEADQAEFERAGYVRAMRAANAGLYTT